MGCPPSRQGWLCALVRRAFVAQGPRGRLAPGPQSRPSVGCALGTQMLRGSVLGVEGACGRLSRLLVQRVIVSRARRRVGRAARAALSGCLGRRDGGPGRCPGTRLGRQPGARLIYTFLSGQRRRSPSGSKDGVDRPAGWPLLSLLVLGLRGRCWWVPLGIQLLLIRELCGLKFQPFSLRAKLGFPGHPTVAGDFVLQVK